MMRPPIIVLPFLAFTDLKHRTKKPNVLEPKWLVTTLIIRLCDNMCTLLERTALETQAE